MQQKSFVEFLEDYYLLILIIILGAALRLYDLNGESIWLDEAYTIDISKYDPVGIVNEILRNNENHPPLYYSFMHYWINLFGDSAISVRFPSVIFALISIFVAYRLARTLFNKNTALLSALILSTSALSIEYSQNARSYTLLALLSLLSFYFFLQLLQKNSFRSSILYTISTILLVYTHHYAIFILVSQNIFFFTVYIFNTNRKHLTLRQWILLQLLFFVLYLPIIYLAMHADALSDSYWMNAPNYKAIPGVLLSYSGSWILFVIFFILSMISVFNLKSILLHKDLKDYTESFFDKTENSELTYIEKIYFLVLWISVPIIIPFLISVMFAPVFQSRFLIGGAAAFFILVAKGIESFGNKKTIISIAGVIIVLSFFNAGNYYTAVRKHEWQEAILYLESEAENGDPILINPSYELRTGLYHLSREDLEMIKFNEESLSELDKDNYDFWVIMSWHGQSGKEPLAFELLKNYNVRSRKDFYKLKVYHYQN